MCKLIPQRQYSNSIQSTWNSPFCYYSPHGTFHVRLLHKQGQNSGVMVCKPEKYYSIRLSALNNNCLQAITLIPSRLHSPSHSVYTPHILHLLNKVQLLINCILAHSNCIVARNINVSRYISGTLGSNMLCYSIYISLRLGAVSEFTHVQL